MALPALAKELDSECMTIQWFPGHMAKAIREIKEKSSGIDVVVEVLDARAPGASRNPVLAELLPGKLRLIILNKADLCDPKLVNLWVSHFESGESVALPVNALNGKDAKKIYSAITQLYKRKNKDLKLIRAVVFGIPNVGKSTLINHLVGKKLTKVADKPGVTQKQVWQKLGEKAVLLDTPGILWPKFENQDIARKLAAINCIQNENYDAEEIAFFLCDYFTAHYPNAVTSAFKIEGPFENALAIFEAIGKRKGCFMSGNQIDLDRVYSMFINDFRAGRLGRMTLEVPEGGF